MFLFVDDTEFKLKGVNDRDEYIQAFGGFVVSQTSLRFAEQIIDSTKNAYQIPLNLPLKWNLRDKKSEYIAAIGEESFIAILAQFDEIRMSIFSQFAQVDAKVLVSFNRYILQTHYQMGSKITFENLLQRFGLILQSNPNDTVNLVAVDRDNARINLLCEVYDDAYRMGTGFHSGPLSSYSIPYLSFSLSVFNPLLQLADLLLGCTSYFVRSALTGTPNRTEFAEMFELILPKFNKDSAGNILQSGLVLSTSMDKSKINAALQANIASN